MFLYMSPWDKCLFMDITSKTSAGQKLRQHISCLGSREEVEFMMGNWGKIIHLLECWD